MKAMYAQMKKTFREKVISRFTGIIKRNRILKFPCLFVMSVILSVYYVYMHFATNVKRYVCVAFSLVLFVSSCSFSFAVFAGEQRGFINAQETYNAIVEDSDAELAVEKEVTSAESLMPDTGKVPNEFGDVENIEDTDFYTLDDILAYHENEGAHDGDVPADEEVQEAVVTEDFCFDGTDWRLVLINKQHPIPDGYDFKLGSFASGMRCDERVIEDLLLMMQAAKKEGINLVVRSPYRASDHQEDNFNNRISSYMREGLSYMEAYKVTSQVITVPGCSEHEVGLALDITSDVYSKLEQPFADTEAGKWLAEHSHEYGFILRYPLGKEYITGIEFEPWHFRYVGREAAAVIKQEDICLEEFWDKYL